ncbi:MAG: aldehyde dehydrogenase family protein [Rhodopila sp.]|nr:aldehyde dehydrogenase family protein [Rhodopila sp.]
MLIGGDWVAASETYDVCDPYRGSLVSTAPRSNKDELDRALAAAVAAKAEAARLPATERAKILRRVAERVVAAKPDIAETMSRETGKAIKDSRTEIDRSADTINLSAEEAVRIEGEHVPLDASPMGFGKIAMLLRFPIGVVAAITPFNAPVNLACHKIGPAIAAGNVAVLKAPPQCPGTIHKLVQCFVDAGLPAGFLNVLYGADIGPALVRDERVEFITFTGSTRAGAQIRAAAGLRRVALELGGIGPTIVHDDASVETAAPLCARNAMRLAGQSCISVQNVYVHERVFERFMERLIAEVGTMKLGDPLDPATDIGTVVDEGAAERIDRTVQAAIAAGATAITGAIRHGAVYEPTVLTNVGNEMPVVCEEIFGPVMTLRPYSEIDPVITEINERRLGLQGGIFTKSLELALKVARTMRVGGVIINGTSTFRTDQLAYGGVKDSGIGREGPRYAIREMTEERLIVFNL